MAVTVATQVLEDGPRNSIIKVTMIGDGANELTNYVIYDASAYQNDHQNNKLMRVQYDLSGFNAALYWYAVSPVLIMNLMQNYPGKMKYFWTGGLYNNAGTGKNGDITITTSGLAAAPSGTSGEVVLYVKKKR